MLGMILVGLIVIYGGIDYTAEEYATGYLKHYIIMSEQAPDLPNKVIQPFIYRILVPYVAGVLPLPYPAAFRTIAIITAAILTTLFYSFLVDRGFNKTISFVVTAVFICNKWFFGTFLWFYFSADDLMALLFILLMFRAMFRGNWLLFGFALVLGAMCREICMIMVPVAAFYLIEKGMLRVNLKGFIVGSLAGVIVFTGLRIILTPSGGLNIYEAFLYFVPKMYGPRGWFDALIRPYLPFTLLPLIFYRTAFRYLNENRYLVFYFLLVFLSSLFGDNSSRYMAPSFIVFYPLIAEIIKEHVWNKGTLTYIILSIMLLGAVLSAFDALASGIPLPNVMYARILTYGSFLVISSVYIYLRYRKPAI
jgi:hypothetical protein